MAITAESYKCADCTVNLPDGRTKQLAAGIYPVVIANSMVQIDIITETHITLAEFARLHAAGLATKMP
jgi:hypothetical protein